MIKNKISTSFILFLIALFPISGNAQMVDLAFEFQAYPTGLLPGLRLEKSIGQKQTLHLRLGYNWMRHRNLGVQEDERGDGFGFSIGYKRYLKADFSGFFFGLKNDFWFNRLDWKDQIGNPDETMGRTKITVIQPTAEIGFLWKWKDTWFLAPNLAFGYEVNVKTEGAKVGEGAILLLGVLLGCRL